MTIDEGGAKEEEEEVAVVEKKQAAAESSPSKTTTTTDDTNERGAHDNKKSDDHDLGDEVLYEEAYRPPFLWALILAPPMLPFFWTYRVRVTTTDLRFGYTYGLTSKTTPRSAIRSVQVVEHVHGLRDWGGWGIRGNWTGGQFEWGYISKNGPGIRVGLAVPTGHRGDPKNRNKSCTGAASAAATAAAATKNGAHDDERVVLYTFLCDDAERVAKILSPQASAAVSIVQALHPS